MSEPRVPRAAACVAVFTTRDRVRATARAAFPKRRARLVFVRTSGDLVRALRTELVDAVLVDVGGGSDDRWLGAELARAFVTAPFFAIVPLRASEGGALAHCDALGVSGVLVDGVDDAAVRELILPLLFTSRFARAFEEPPAAFGLSSPLQRSAWARIVDAAGRLARTEELAAALGVTREHLSRSFGRGAPRLKRVIDLVRLAAAAELARNPGHRVRDIASILGFTSSSHLARASLRLVGAAPTELAGASGAELVARFVARHSPVPAGAHPESGAPRRGRQLAGATPPAGTATDPAASLASWRSR